MAVPEYRRSISKKEYFYKFKKIEKEILSLLIRDFGIEEDSTPEWLIKNKRDEILKSLTIISSYISRADAIYPQNEDIKKETLLYQARAIQECYVLHDNIQFCSEIFCIKNINVYTIIANEIKEEVSLLRIWRKGVNKIVFS